MSEFSRYVREIMSSTSHIFRSLKKYIAELAKVLLLEGVYIDKVIVSVTRMEYVHLTLLGYDDDADYEIEARWERTYDNISDPYIKQYDLVDVGLEEIEYV